ncbi:MAG: hypothetical protein ACLFUS_07835 [Candidatus Sumerlaeia bacterium]
MNRVFSWILILVFCLGATACSNLETLQKANRLEREMRVDRLRHFEKISEAYFLIGLEYYTMAKEAEMQGHDAKAKEYAAKAKFYNLFHKDLQKTTDEMRQELKADLDLSSQ